MKTRFIFLFCLVLFLALPALAKDTWINVRSKNFFLVGNASEKDIRGVATKLEQFRETFRRVFPRAKFNNAVQTNVVVFKSDSSYKPFKPKRADGKIDEWLAGYFQAGEDVNYITLSTEGQKEDTYGTIFHEYTHFLLETNMGDADIPAWFNEGLAEYYQTFQMKEDIKATLGIIQQEHLNMLQRTPLIPLQTFFSIDHYQLQQTGNHSRSIFYAQSWALMHYLIQGNKGANQASLDKFLSLLRNKVEPEQAFRQSFGYDYATMEAALKKYVEQRTFQATLVTFQQKLVFDTEMTVTPLADAEANAYLGDLLYHIGEYADAETYLKTALSLDANSSLANTSMGLVRMRQRKFDEAKKYLEKAIAGGQKNHIAYYNYAHVLSRESMDEFGYVTNFPAEKARAMRQALLKAIEINPEFTESYRMLGFVNLVNNENLDEAITYLKKVLEIQPGNQESLLAIARIYLRQEKYKEAHELAQRLVKNAGEQRIHNEAQSILNTVDQFESAVAQSQRETNDRAARGERPLVIKNKKSLTEAEIKQIEEDREIYQLNRQIHKPKPGDRQATGYMQKVACIKGEVIYTFKTDTEILTFVTKDFSELDLSALTTEAEDLSFGCDAKVQDILAVITYRPAAPTATAAAAKTKPALMTVAFVPKFFKLRTAEELAKTANVVLVDDSERPERPEMSEEAKAAMEEQRRAGILKWVNDSLRKPQDGEKREIGILERVECPSRDKILFFVNTGSSAIKLRALSPKDLILSVFTQEISQIQLGCGAKPPPINAVITYRPETDPKAKENGMIVAIEYVPKSYKLP
jgi:tetratricopeptide (TPR) repeat protein